MDSDVEPVDLKLARVTVTMQGVRAGQVVLVNPQAPVIAKLLRVRYLVLVEDE